MYPWKIHPHILIYITYIQYSSLLFYLLLRLQSPIDSFEVLLLLLLLILLLLFPRLYPPTFSAIWPTQTFIFHSGFLKSHMRSSFMKTTNIHPLPNIKRVDSQSNSCIDNISIPLNHASATSLYFYIEHSNPTMPDSHPNNARHTIQ